MIVVLNGTSSAGKTSLAKALQQAMLPRVFVVQGIDSMTFALPRCFLGAPWSTEVFRYARAADGTIEGITAGPVATRLTRALHAAVAAMARTGLDVIVDHVLLDPSWKLDLDRATVGLPTLVVGVRCPLAVLVQRELERNDRTLGQASAQFPVVHRGIEYDVEIDTSCMSPQEGAEAVAERIRGEAGTHA